MKRGRPGGRPFFAWFRWIDFIDSGRFFDPESSSGRAAKKADSVLKVCAVL